MLMLKMGAQKKTETYFGVATTTIRTYNIQQHNTRNIERILVHDLNCINEFRLEYIKTISVLKHNNDIEIIFMASLDFTIISKKLLQIKVSRRFIFILHILTSLLNDNNKKETERISFMEKVFLFYFSFTFFYVHSAARLDLLEKILQLN